MTQWPLGLLHNTFLYILIIKYFQKVSSNPRVTLLICMKWFNHNCICWWPSHFTLWAETFGNHLAMPPSSSPIAASAFEPSMRWHVAEWSYPSTFASDGWSYFWALKPSMRYHATKWSYPSAFAFEPSMRKLTARCSYLSAFEPGTWWHATRWSYLSICCPIEWWQ